MVSVAALLAFPRLAAFLDAPWLGGPPVLALLGLSALSGLFLALAGRSRIVSLHFKRIDEAVEVLTRPDSPRTETLAAAVRLLDLAHLTAGPTTVEAFQPEEMKERLGAAWDLVIEVERALVEEGLVYATFTLDPPVEEGS